MVSLLILTTPCTVEINIPHVPASKRQSQNLTPSPWTPGSLLFPLHWRPRRLQRTMLSQDAGLGSNPAVSPKSTEICLPEVMLQFGGTLPSGFCAPS